MDLPLRYDITIPQRATFRERIQLPIDCTDREVVAQVWRVKNGRRIDVDPLLTFEVEWIDRAVSLQVEVDGSTVTATYGDFYLVGSWEATSAIDEPAQWDLLLIEGNSLARAGERTYWLEGVASINPGLSAAPGGM